MKVLRTIQYLIIIACAVLVIVILTYNGKKTASDSEGESTVATFEDDTVIISDGEISIGDVMDAASVIISDVKEEIKDVVSNVSVTKENKSGEIDYAEIVRLQEEEVALSMQADVSASNAAHGIVVSTSTSTSASKSASVEKTYYYVVNKTTGKIHKVGCLLEPEGKNAGYYEKMEDVKRAGYTDKCTVCSP